MPAYCLHRAWLAVFTTLCLLAATPVRSAARLASPLPAAQDESLRILPQPLPDAVSSREYSVQLRATGGRAPFKWRVRSGELPPGLKLNTDTGVIYGVPQNRGVWKATMAVTDAAGHTVTADIVIGVALPLFIETLKLPDLVSSSGYNLPLVVRGGVAPYRWQVVAGQLPPGLRLDPLTGVLFGQPTQLGYFSFTVRVTDSARPPQSAERTFLQRVYGPLTADWVDPPASRDGGIFGSLKVTNSSNHNVLLTVIVVAVNEYGKAFTLGYQHFELPTETESPVIPFGFTLPRGTYMVRVDAVGEVPQTNTIQRAFREMRTLIVE